MTDHQLRHLGDALDQHLQPLLYCCAYSQTFAHLNTYVRGLLSDLPRKTCEPIALKAGTPVRTLQEFLKDHDWDADRVLQQHQQHSAQLLEHPEPNDDLGHVGFLDETSSVKKGDKTPGVQRQYLGCVGKIDNGIVSVHVGVCQGRFKTLLDADLFLPQSWSDDRPRCRAAGIPDEVVHRPKWQIALEQLDRIHGNGVSLDWLTFDAEYGKVPAFLTALEADTRQLLFVGEVPCTLSCLARHRRGLRPDEQVSPRTAKEVAQHGSLFQDQSWQIVRLSQETQQEQVWRVKAAQVWQHGTDGWSTRCYWLLWASNDGTGEEKFLLSNAAADVPVERLVRVAFRRWQVEHCFRVAKSELGFTHFEGRNYQALRRHLSLCLVALGFVAEHTERLREKKPGVDVGAGVPWFAAGEPALAAGAAG